MAPAPEFVFKSKNTFPYLEGILYAFNIKTKVLEPVGSNTETSGPGGKKLTEAKEIKILWKNPKKEEKTGVAKAEGALGNIVYKQKNTDFVEAGLYEWEAEVEWEAGLIENFPSENVNVFEVQAIV